MKGSLRTFWVEDSSLISRIDYWPEEEKMDVLFKADALYRYSGIDRADFGAICSAKSVGSAFHAIVAEKDYERLM